MDDRTLGHRSKLHLRVRTLGGQTLRILTPRPGTDLLLSNNYFHETWHLLSDERGARQLGQLAWMLAYSQQPQTLVLLDAPFVVASPFDGDRARPVLLVPGAQTWLGRKALRALFERRGALGPPDRSVRINTQSLSDACEEGYGRFERHEIYAARESVSVREGFIEYRADTLALKLFAMLCAKIRIGAFGSTYDYLADRDGELQLFSDFRARVSCAQIARSLSGLPPGFAVGDEQVALWRATERALEQRQRAAYARAAPR